VAWSDSQVTEARTLTVPAARLEKPGRYLLRSAADRKRKAAAVVRPDSFGAEGRLNPALAASLGAEAEMDRCDLEYSPWRGHDLIRYGRGGLLATLAALGAFLLALGAGVAGLATSKLPLAFAIALLVLAVVVAIAKLAVDLRALRV
jgi:hypothetical protein